MRSTVVLGHLEHGVDPSGAPLFPAVKCHVGCIWYEVRFPHSLVEQRAIPDEVVRLGIESIVETMGSFKDEVQVVVEPHHRRSGGDSDVSCGVVATTIEVLVRGVKWNRKKASGMPFECLLVGVVCPDRCRSAARYDINELFVQMMFGLRFTAWPDLDDMGVVSEVIVGDIDYRA